MKIIEFLRHMLSAHVLLHMVLSVLLMNTAKAVGVPYWLAAVTVTALVLLKECVYDKKMGMGTFRMKDIYGGMAGILVGTLAYV